MTFLFSPARLWAIGLLFNRRIEQFINRRGEEIRFVSRKKHNDAFRIA